MKVNYIKTIGFRKFEKTFETELYDITNITGKNRSGKSNILYAIINIMLGTNLSGDERATLINRKSDASYGELHFTDNTGQKHVLIRGKHKYSNKGNFISLDGKAVTQTDLTSFYKDKKLFLSIINPLYFLSKKPAEQKEMVDKYLSDIKPYYIFNTLDRKQQDRLIKKYFKIPTKEIYDKLSYEYLKNIYQNEKLKEHTNKEFEELSEKELKDTICKYVKEIKDIKFYEQFSEKEKENFINLNMFDIFLDIAFDNLSKEEQAILEGMPTDIPKYITDLNDNIKTAETKVKTLDGKIDYAQNIADEKLPELKQFEKDVELSLARQELSFLNSNQAIIDKEKQRKTVEKLEKEILDKETESKQLTKKMKEGKKKYLAIKSGECTTCPTCNQGIRDESKTQTIINMKADLEEAFDKNNVLETQLKDLRFTLAIERCNYHALEGNSTIEKSKRITVIEENIRNLENEKLEIEKFNKELSVKSDLIKNAKEDISIFKKEQTKYNKYIDNVNKAKKVAQKLYIYYIEEKMKLAKQYLTDVNVKFYSILKTTGEIKEDFIITYKNSPLSDLSRSETIATALEFANMFNKISGANFPIFIDDYESCADYDFISRYSKDTQLIIAKVKKGNLLTISDGNSNESTVIKPMITGFRTMNTYSNNLADIPKAA